MIDDASSSVVKHNHIPTRCNFYVHDTIDCSNMTTCTITASNDYGKVSGTFQGLLRTDDRIIQTVRLEGGHAERHRYLSIVCNDIDEYCLLGIDYVWSKPQEGSEENSCSPDSNEGIIPQVILYLNLP